MVVGDQAALVVDAELPVEPDPGGQGEQPLGDPDPQPLRSVGAMAFQPELVVEGVEGALDPLAEAAQRPEPVRLVTAVGPDQHRAELAELLGEGPAGQALVGGDDYPLAQQPVVAGQPQQLGRDLALPQPRGGKSPGHRHAVRSANRYSLRPSTSASGCAPSHSWPTRPAPNAAPSPGRRRTAPGWRPAAATGPTTTVWCGPGAPGPAATLARRRAAAGCSRTGQAHRGPGGPAGARRTAASAVRCHSPTGPGQRPSRPARRPTAWVAAPALAACRAAHPR